MRDYVKMTNHDGQSIYANVSLILTIEPGHSNGSTVKMAMSEMRLQVKESPEQIFKLLKNQYTNI